MAVEHTPPSTYILRELHDVTVPDSVSWMPQTIGWKILGGLLLIFVGYLVYRYCINWWDNRYRQEAIKAIDGLDNGSDSLPHDVFAVLKVVLVHLNSSNANLFGQNFIVALDSRLERPLFNDDVSSRWIHSLVNPTVQFEREEREIICERAVTWLKTHSGCEDNRHD